MLFSISDHITINLTNKLLSHLLINPFTAESAGALDVHQKESAEWREKHDNLHQQHQALTAQHAEGAEGGDANKQQLQELQKKHKVLVEQHTDASGSVAQVSYRS